MKIFTAFLLSSLMVMCCLSPLPAAESVSDIQDRAVRMYSAGRYRLAASLYRKVVEAQPNSRGAIKDYLLALWNGENYDEASNVAERLVALSPNDIEVRFLYARALLATGRREKALKEFKACRVLDPNEQHIQLAEARVEGLLRRYDDALAHMQALRKAHPDYQEIYPELARVQQVTGDYARAADTWGKAVEFFPDNSAYIFHLAECLFYGGRREEALKRLDSLANQTPPYAPAVDLLVDSLLARGESAKARQLLGSQLQNLRLDDEVRWVKLLHLNLQEKRWSDAVKEADRWLALEPHSGVALMAKAAAWRQLGEHEKAIGIYQDIVKQNPSAIGALKEMAQAQDASGRPQDAVRTIGQAMILDPTDPYLLLTQSYYLFNIGERQQAHDLLNQWMVAHPDPAVPALLYHGVTGYPQDPILAYSIHQSTTTLDDHFRVLKDAGYTAITTEQMDAWIHGRGSLPERPILITFDDNRLDSFRGADPLLKTHGLKATMFVPLMNVEGYLPLYAAWPDVIAYRDTGRWEIASHGDKGHARVTVDGEGREGLYLLNRQWLPSEKRWESGQEWTTRARGDYERSRDKIKRRLGQAPVAYSFPEGNYGHEDIPNSPDAAQRNLEWAAAVFGTAYHQDDAGFNTKGRDPTRLTRYKPFPGQSSRSLARHLTDRSPKVAMTRRLLRMAIWDQKYREALDRLEDLRRAGASNSCLWAEEARIREGQGDHDEARALALKAYQEDNSDENRDLLNEITTGGHLTWTGRFQYQEDNRSRISRRFRQGLGDWRSLGIDWSLHHLFGSYSESLVPTVTENGGGVAAARNLTENHRLSLEATGHALNKSARDNWSLTGLLHSDWTETVSTNLQSGRTIYDSARAIQANIIRTFASAEAQWKPSNDWRASARTRLERLSDDNKRASAGLEGGRRLFWPRFWLVGRAIIDSMEDVSPNYYSPQVLHEVQLGLDYTLPLGRWASLNVVYLPGYGKEKTSDSVFVNDIDVTLPIHLTRSLELVPAVSLIRQPGYHRDSYSAQVAYRF